MPSVEILTKLLSSLLFLSWKMAAIVVFQSNDIKAVRVVYSSQSFDWFDFILFF